MIDDMLKAENWQTSGWTLAGGKWIELGHVRGIVNMDVVEYWFNKPLPFPAQRPNGSWWFQWDGPAEFARGPYRSETMAVQSIREFVERWIEKRDDA